MRNSKLLVVGLVGAMIALTAGVYIGMGARIERTPEPSVSSEAIARLFTTHLNDSEGKQQTLKQWQGNTLVINFWATWCPPCREEMPSFSRLQTKFAANGVQFVGIALDTAENVINFSKQYPSVYPLLIADSEGVELTRLLGNSRLALPYTVVLAANNEVRLARLGRVSEQELDILLQKVTAR
ncbi:MAG: TlpA family protein disulfide reductase [Propionivibrio sp.]|uniref:TlpA family protein disulfide reductase n=1 Tax=Propionivibrio sp. TaxID=2212460 RepID=UPI001A3964B3|nr:TlpA disulfide reductase family protein [Propionivibrio sp.]MBL8414652.1 TlpA family protein disulfide reductase [Propionivibrio sp.]